MMTRIPPQADVDAYAVQARRALDAATPTVVRRGGEDDKLPGTVDGWVAKLDDYSTAVAGGLFAGLLGGWRDSGDAAVTAIENSLGTQGYLFSAGAFVALAHQRRKMHHQVDTRDSTSKWVERMGDAVGTYAELRRAMDRFETARDALAASQVKPENIR